ncbi:MAG: response regulator [Alcanivoracaceae bacterium]|nr:response regulator [Alcanivoracaceae bacterium]
MIKIILVDDHEIVRTGLKMIVAKMPGIKILAEAENGQQAIDLANKLKPDVILMDVNMPIISGIEATRRITQHTPHTKIIILTVHAENPFPAQLLEAGASGYLTKGCAAHELEIAINTVAKDGRYIGTDIAQQMALSLLPGGESSPFDELSSREMEVMLLLAQGKNPNDIGKILLLSPKTVATYKYRILEKLKLKNIIELVHLTIRHGILEDNTT